MPFIRIDVANGLSTATRKRLLRETSALVAEITESPLDRVHSHVHELPAGDVAVGGVTIAEAGVQSPFISVELHAGRPIEHHREIIERTSALVAEILDIPIERTQLRINEIPPHDWGIGGVPASDLPRSVIEPFAADSPPG